MEISSQDSTMDYRRSAFLEGVNGAAIGSVYGFAASTFYEIVRASVNARACCMPSAAQILKSAIVTTTLAAGIGGFGGYRHALEQQRLDRGLHSR
jgi:hypothetical protein